MPCGFGFDKQTYLCLSVVPSKKLLAPPSPHRRHLSVRFRSTSKDPYSVHPLDKFVIGNLAQKGCMQHAQALRRVVAPPDSFEFASLRRRPLTTCITSSHYFSPRTLNYLAALPPPLALLSCAFSITAKFYCNDSAAPSPEASPWLGIVSETLVFCNSTSATSSYDIEDHLTFWLIQTERLIY